MARKLVLDTGPLGDAVRAVSHPRQIAIGAWLVEMDKAKAIVVIPGIADYELRRNMLLEGMKGPIRRLDAMKAGGRYVPISEKVMLRAADLWAKVRTGGKPTAGNEALDGDCIVAATAWSITKPGDEVIVITTNVKDLARFPGITAMEWQDVKP
jgi:predicted nucleic acid-binding protein